MIQKLFFALLVVQFGYSQQRTCGMEQNMERNTRNLVERQNYLNLQAKFEIELAKLKNNQNRLSNSNTTILIPVAVHFPDAGGSSSCLTALAQNQIAILNLDYNATNTDISQWAGASAFYPDVNVGNLNVQFIIANQNHPLETGLSNGDLAITFGTDFLNGSYVDTTWSGYLNIVCRDIGGLLGTSPLGGSPLRGDAVEIAIDAFGSGSGCTGYVPGSIYNLGRTLTHELGHFFNLNHTFITCANTNCASQGDKVCDTPPSNDAAYYCPAPGEITNCGVKTLTMNYMDYTNDACMYMFTAGQATRMLAYYNSISSQFRTAVLGNNDYESNNFTLIPNPNKGIFYLQLKELGANYSVHIYDTTGRLILEKEFSQNQDLNQKISLNGAVAGIYFISVKSEGVVSTKKFLID